MATICILNICLPKRNILKYFIYYSLEDLSKPKMTLIEAQKRILDLNISLFQTQDVCGCLKVTVSNASKILERLAQSGSIKKIARGKWMLASVLDPDLLPEFLTAPYPSYLSLQTALYHYGMISQIPSVTYAVSLARTQRIKTPIGMISIHHVHPDFFFGYEYYKDTLIKIATKEKALLDVLYLTTSKTHLFKSLPELDLPKDFDVTLAKQMIDKIPSARLKTIVNTRLTHILNQSSLNNTSS